MYFQMTKGFLDHYPKADLFDMFMRLGVPARATKPEAITAVLKRFEEDEKLGPCRAWIHICPYCRFQGYLATPKKIQSTPRFCTRCGRTSPRDALDTSLKKTEEIVVLASKMNLKKEKPTKAVLLEQALVTVITGLEVLMREVYSLIYDHQHVVMGQPIYEDTYARTRNEFLNFGSAARWLRKVTGLNMKTELPADDYGFLSRMYSARHIIVHNSSIKDRDFLSQTGDPESELNAKLALGVPDVRTLIRLARRIARQVDCELRQSILSYHHNRLALTRAIRGRGMESRTNRSTVPREARARLTGPVT